uniref:Uncharacterized protein n=1 Tax=viral metagenome TaxID=1070528 RepID=A0A6M3IM86_9ZZZZ
MLLPEELDDQGKSPVDDDQDDDQSDNDNAGDGEGDEDTPKLVKIGDKEYTPEQVADMEKKASGYDALLPEFTQKSQKLAELEKANKLPEDLPSYKKEDWNPKTMPELAKAIEEAEERGMNRALGTLEQRQAEATKVKQEVDDFVTDIKRSDKDFDEQDFFSYASKHKFPVKTIDDLRAVHSSYDELQKTAESSKEDGRKGKEGRRDRVNNPAGGKEESLDFSDLRVKGGSILDVAMGAFDRLKK